MQIQCPICRKKTTWEENPNRPFCSERCKVRDLGNWATGEYSIEGNEPALNEDEEAGES